MASIKKKFGLVILAAFFLSSAHAENASGRHGISLNPNIGIIYGNSEEIVYKDPPQQDLYMSELIWDLKPLLYIGLDVDYKPLGPSLANGFAAAFSVKSGLPFKSGTIADSDWINPSAEHYLTHYSQHDAYSRTAVLLDASAGYSWRFGALALNVYGEFSFMHFSWSAKDGYTQYASWDPAGNKYLEWNDGLQKNYGFGEVMRYAQTWFILSPGLSLSWDIGSFFSLKGLFNYSPLIYCANKDDHLMGNITFHDYLYFGHYFKWGGALAFSPLENTSLSLSLSYKKTTGSRGDTFQGKTLSAKNGAGAAFSALDLGFCVMFFL